MSHRYSPELERLHESIRTHTRDEPTIIVKNMENYVRSKRNEYERDVLSASENRIEASGFERKAAEFRERAARYEHAALETKLIIDIAEQWIALHQDVG